MPQTDRYIRFPPGRQNILIPTTPRSALSIGISLYAASLPRAIFAQNLLWLAGMTVGSWAIPGPRESWTPPIGPTEIEALSIQWQKVVGGSVDAYAIYERPQVHRSVLTLMLCAGPKSVLLRVRSNPDELRRERAISFTAQRSPPRSFAVPREIDSGEAAGWYWSAYEAMGTRPHRPARPLPGSGHTEISSLVEATLDRPADVPDHWRGAHRDLTPWNLRRSGGRSWLIDWEDVGWAPPGADAVYFRAVSVATRRGIMRTIHLSAAEQEAADYWAAELRRRPVEPGEDLNKRILLALGRPVEPVAD